MEACATAHFWAREIAALGHEVKLMPPSYVKAYLRRQKNDAADAEAICRALRRFADQLEQTTSGSSDCDCSTLHPLAALFQEAETDEAYLVLGEQGLPILLEIFDRMLPRVVADDGEDLIFLHNYLSLHKTV